MKAIWITWESQSRNVEVSEALGFELLQWSDLEAMPRLARYFRGLWRTWATVHRHRPSIVACQNPSIVLAAEVVLLRPIYGYRLLVDAHNAGVRPLEGRSRVLNAFVRWIHRRADLVIVTNETLGHVVRAQGADAAVLPDGLPNITQAPREAVAEEQSVLLICSYAEDEPYGEVFSAAEELGGEAKVYVTGKYKKVGLTPEDVPKNVVLLGYVSDAEFLEFVKSVKVAVDLTTRDDCLVRGAYEALAAGTPFVVSDTPVLRELFEGAAIFCRNDRRSIAEAIHTALAENREYRDRVLQTREDYRERWSEQAKALRDRLGSA